MNICPICGRNRARTNKKPFTKDTLRQHIRDAHKNEQNKPKEEDPVEELGLDLTDMIAGDESDGVFWGIAHELGEF